jgi:hypothetical protein
MKFVMEATNLIYDLGDVLGIVGSIVDIVDVSRNQMLADRSFSDTDDKNEATSQVESLYQRPCQQLLLATSGLEAILPNPAHTANHPN